MKDACSLKGCQLLWLMRPLQAAVASGSVSSLVVSLAREALRSDYPAFVPEVCLPPLLEQGWELDCRSLVVGVFIGLALGPIIDTLFFLRQAWFGALQRGARSGRAAFRILE